MDIIFIGVALSPLALWPNLATIVLDKLELLLPDYNLVQLAKILDFGYCSTFVCIW